jgi:hypothetical protein
MRHASSNQGRVEFDRRTWVRCCTPRRLQLQRKEVFVAPLSVLERSCIVSGVILTFYDMSSPPLAPPALPVTHHTEIRWVSHDAMESCLYRQDTFPESLRSLRLLQHVPICGCALRIQVHIQDLASGAMSFREL